MSVSQHSTGLGVGHGPHCARSSVVRLVENHGRSGSTLGRSKEVLTMSLTTSTIATMLPVTDTARAKEF